ncbi:MAG: carboxynorspermidine decarboxylase [Oscillospiraceae bacterium]|nr:carboxynorspermidine decarboxylase [Oscillospiraceae bacterium]
MIDIDFEALNKIPTPSYVVDEDKIIKNLEILDSVQKQTGCKILLAQKAFSMYCLYPLIGQYLKGTAASGLFEAKLGHEEMGGETHIFSPAYHDEEFDEIAQICNHIIFNSFGQFNKFANRVRIGRAGDKQVGLRINPEYSEIEHEIYNPCAKNSRFGVKIDKLKENNEILKELDGLHFHTMCEQNSDVLWRTVQILDEEFGEILALDNIKWVNFGGGHHITREEYDIETLVKSIMFIKDKYNVEVYLEPGEAVALNTGILVAQVLDFVDGDDFPVAILDASAACHMPDVLEIPYTPDVFNSGRAGEKQYSYIFGGNTCLAGDIIGDYSFDSPLNVGDKIIFGDMAHYTMVKNNTFNGIKLPSIVLLKQNGEVKIVKEFGYDDFKTRLS